MRHSAYGVLLAVLTAAPASAQDGGTCEPPRMLYALQASAGRIDGYRLDRRGGLAPGGPSASAPLARKFARRLVANPVKNVLYVAEVDRVEAFRLGRHGGLRSTPCARVADPSAPCRSATAVSAAKPHDLAVSADGRTLYVTERGLDRLAAYPLGDDGMLAMGATPQTCVPGGVRTNRQRAGYRDVAVNGTLVYVSEDGFSPRRGTGRIDVFQTLQEPEASAQGLPAGSLCPQPPPEPCVPMSCETTTPTTTNTSTSTSTSSSIVPSTTTSTSTSTTTTIRAAVTRLRQPSRILIDPVEKILYVEESAARRIVNFRLDPADGLFVVPDGETMAPVASETRRGTNYADLVLHRSVSADGATRGLILAGSRFFQGRIRTLSVRVKGSGDDACDLPPGVLGCLPVRPTGTTRGDLFMSPVGLVTDRHVDPASGQVRETLYAAGGDLDRVRAFHIRVDRRGRLGLSPTHFSESARARSAFPNRLAIAVLAGECE